MINMVTSGVELGRDSAIAITPVIVLKYRYDLFSEILIIIRGNSLCSFHIKPLRFILFPRGAYRQGVHIGTGCTWTKGAYHPADRSQPEHQVRIESGSLIYHLLGESVVTPSDQFHSITLFAPIPQNQSLS